MKRIIGVNTNSYHGFSLEEALRGIAAAGFSYVELVATKGWTEHVFPSQSFEYLLSIKSLLKELNLKAFAISGHCNLMDEDRLGDFRANIELASFFGCTYIVSSVGEAHLEDKAIVGTEHVAKNIKSLLPLLEELNMELVLEIHGDHSTAKHLLEIVEAVNSPRVGINYDTANAIFYGDVDPEIDMLACGDSLKFMHIKDKAGEKKEWNFPALGQGYVKFPKIFKNLKDLNNNCPLSLEIEFTEKGPSSLEEVNDAVKVSFDYLKEVGI